VYWPALLMAAGEAPPQRIHVHGFLLVGGEKMSKTAFNQIAPADLVPDFGVDGYRYHFLRDQAFGPDGEFSYEGMVARYNADLANNLGNLLSRVTTVVAKQCGGVGPAPSAASGLAAVAGSVYEATAAAWERVAPSEALEATWRLVRETNAALEAAQPWKMAPGPELDAVMGDALEALRIVALLAYPAMPTAAQEIWRRIGLDGPAFDGPALHGPALGGTGGSIAEQRLPEAAAWGGYPGGLRVEKAPPLFPRIKSDVA
jgi:methionyl-tRNA synthetase